MKTINVGVIGLGRIGKVHLENLLYRIPEAHVITAYDPNRDKQNYAKELGVPVVTQSEEEAINHEQLDAVFICSPTTTHVDIIKKAIDGGKHIFCEKPLDLSIDNIETVSKWVNKSEIKLQVGFNRRFDANFKHIRQEVQEGNIGEPHILTITSRDPTPPPIEFIPTSGGLFMDMTIHDFDMARFIVGSEVVEVFAKAAVKVDDAIKEFDDVDTATIQLEFANGCLGQINNSRQSGYGYDQRLEIFGSNGMARLGNNYPNSTVVHNKKGRHSVNPLYFFMERYTEAYCEEVRSFVKAVVNDTPVEVSVADALAATKIALACKASIHQNLPIKL
jgi:myo-inositol 2-dehydrogenase/D-chiro-inositol 1-dehydrogenase